MKNQDQSKTLESIILNAKKLVAFTGAGLSAESGIPTYRGAGGLWSQYDPAKYADINYFMCDPAYYWNFFKDVRYPLLKDAQPNRAHFALAELERRGILMLSITQNIDGLLQLAGQKNVCELHGNTRNIKCMDCLRKYPMEEVFQRLQEKLPPLCPICKGLLKPDVVMFGEQLSQKVLQRAWQSAQECDTFLVVGSSLQVNPAAQIPMVAKHKGAKVIIINLDPTPLDNQVDLVTHRKASEVFSFLIP